MHEGNSPPTLCGKGKMVTLTIQYEHVVEHITQFWSPNNLMWIPRRYDRHKEINLTLRQAIASYSSSSNEVTVLGAYKRRTFGMEVR